MNTVTFRSPAAWTPVMMSFLALCLVLGQLLLSGPARQPDEGAAAHLWQLLMAGQIPLLIFYAARWLPRTPMPALLMMGIQMAAVAAAVAPVYLLGWA